MAEEEKPLKQEDLCCCCGLVLVDVKDHHYVNFRYQVPGTPSENILVAVICAGCGTDADNPAKFPVVELLINTRIIRVERPEILWTPMEYLEW